MSALAGLLLAFVLPAVAGALVLSRTSDVSPAAVSPDAVLSRGVACGLATWLLGSGLLARTVGLSATSAWVWDAVVAAVSVVVLLLPGNRPRLRAVLAPAGRRLAEVGGLTALIFLPLGYSIIHTSWSPLGSTPWYYYGLARQVADGGSLPATSIEFGTATPFLNDYHLFTTGTAMLLVQHPGGPITVLTIVTLVGVLLLGIGAVALTSALGAGRVTALLAVPFAISAGVAPLRQSAYRPEGFALGLTLLLVALAIGWLRDRDLRSLVAAALLAATLSQVHGIAAITAAVMVASAALVSIVRGPPGEQLRRTAIALAALLAAVVVCGLVFHGSSGTATAGGLVDRGGLADPTWEFYQAARDAATSTPPSNVSMIGTAVRESYDWQLWWIVPALLLASFGLWRRRRDARTRQLVAFTLLSLLGLLAVASVFMFGWQGYVPRRTGASRIVLEATMLGPPFFAIGLGCLAREAWTVRGRRVLPGPRLLRLGLLAVFSVCAVTLQVRLSNYYDGQAPSREDVAMWRSLPLTSDDVVLANGYTEGFIPDVTPGQGLLDGRAPYTFDALLHRANGLLRDAQGFYADPAKHWDYLARNDVSWVVVGEPGSWSLGTANQWETRDSVRALETCAGLERVTASPSLTVFRVIDPSPQGCAR